MDIAMVDQSLIDQHLERIQRFVENVNAFQSRLNEMLSGRISDNQTQEPVSYQQEAPAIKEPAVVTADDVDIDAIINGIDLNGELGL